MRELVYDLSLKMHPLRLNHYIAAILQLHSFDAHTALRDHSANRVAHECDESIEFGALSWWIYLK